MQAFATAILKIFMFLSSVVSPKLLRCYFATTSLLVRYFADK